MEKEALLAWIHHYSNDIDTDIGKKMVSINLMSVLVNMKRLESSHPDPTLTTFVDLQYLNGGLVKAP